MSGGFKIHFRRKNCAVVGCSAKEPLVNFKILARAWGEDISLNRLINPPKGDEILTERRVKNTSLC